MREAARLYPGRIAVGIDARDGRVAVEGWALQSDVSALDLGRMFEDSGVAAIIYTDIARDGVLMGLNIAADGGARRGADDPRHRLRAASPRSRTSSACSRPIAPSSRGRSRGGRSTTGGSMRREALALLERGGGMLKSRVIPCLDVKDGRVVKGVNFVNLRDAGDPVECAIAYDKAGADELCFLDITASHEDRGILLDVVGRTAEVCFMPLTVGGGVRKIDDIRQLLLAGADKVSINSAAVADRQFVRAGCRKIRQPMRGRRHRRQAGRCRGAGRSSPTAAGGRRGSTPSPSRARSRSWGRARSC